MKKAIFLLIIFFLCSMGVYAFDIIKYDDGSCRIFGKHYAVLFNDVHGGYMYRLVVDDEDFEELELEVRRGNCFSDSREVRAKVLKAEWKDNVYTLTTERGIFEYTFTEDQIIIKSTITEDVTGGFVLFSRNVKYVIKDGEFIKCPIKERQKPNGIIWVKNRAAVKIDGDVICRGPYYTCQVFDFSGNKGDSKTMIITPVTLTKEQQDFSIHNPDTYDMNIFSPVNYQVFQRNNKNKGKMPIAGRVSNNVKEAFYRITGKDYKNKIIDTKWKKIKIDSFNSFNEIVDINAGGWYKVEVKYKVGNEEKIETVEKVGIGEVIINIGQSNSTNSGEELMKTESGYVSTTDGFEWRKGDDPQLRVHDNSQMGSYCPVIGDLLYKEFNVPIAFSSLGYGGTNLESWQPDGIPVRRSIYPYLNLYHYFMDRVYKFGPYGIRCIIWHQGEADVFRSREYYYKKLSDIIWASRRDAGWNIPWITAQATYHPSRGNVEKTRLGQADLWANKVSLEGPDSDQWQTEYRDQGGKGIHFNKKGLLLHGEAWAKSIAKYIHEQMK